MKLNSFEETESKWHCTAGVWQIPVYYNLLGSTLNLHESPPILKPRCAVVAVVWNTQGSRDRERESETTQESEVCFLRCSTTKKTE